MSRGLGRVQNGCLRAIYFDENHPRPKRHKHRGELLTTFDIAAEVFQVDADADGFYQLTDAQYVATKRALENLQRKGQVIGFRMNHDERYYRWMSEKRAQQWLRDKKNADRGVRAKMLAIGIKAR
jgi:hypothetical protein